MNKPRIFPVALAAMLALAAAAPSHSDPGIDREGLAVRDSSADSPPVSDPAPTYPAMPEETSVGVRRGDMDVHFGNSLASPGLSSYRFNVAAGGSRDDRALGIIALPNGGSYVVGRVGVLTEGNRTGTRLGFMRLLPNGRADSGFGGGNGRQVLDVLPALDNRELDLQFAEGLVVDLGFSGILRFYLLGPYRYPLSTDGDVDFAVVCMGVATGGPNAGLFEPCPNFGSNGLVVINFDDGDGFRRDIPQALYLDTRGVTTDWRILVAGRADRNDGGSVNVDMAIARLDLFSGVPDTTFSGNGRLTVAIDQVTRGEDSAYSLLVKPNGKILVGGSAEAPGFGASRAVLLQLASAGFPDFGFCATGNTDCDSPATLRNGRRGWDDDPSGNLSSSRVSALTFTPGQVDPATIVVRTRGTGGSRAGAVSRVLDNGGCGSPLCTTAILEGFQRILPVAAVADASGVVIAAYGEITGSELSNTHVFRVFTSFGSLLDQAFTSIVPFPRQDWDVPTSDDSPRVSRPSAIVRDSKGRYLVAGWHRSELAQDDNRFLIARLQGDVIYEHSFDYGGPPSDQQQ